jgi:hypothetical protein
LTISSLCFESFRRTHVNIKGGELELVLPAYGGEYWDKDKGTFIWDNDKDTDKSTDTIANMPS